MALADLSAEERAALKAELDSFQEPEDPIAELATIIEIVGEKIQELCARMDKLEDFIQNGLIGGLDALATERAKVGAISDLKGKYGSLFPDTYGGYLKDHLGDNYGDALWELIYADLEKLKGTDGYTDEVGESSIKSLAENIGKRVTALTGTAPETETPAAEETASAEPGDTGEDPMADVRAMILKFRNKGGQAA